MSATLTTGHEACYDFPAFTGRISCTYLIATVPRTGSSMLAHLLWETGLLGSPLEYFNYEPGGPQGAALEAVRRQDELWRRTLRYRTSPNGVFGVKGFPSQFEDLGRTNPRLLDEVIRFLLPGGGNARVVWLKRRDTTAHAISYARATMTGRWRKEQEDVEQGEDASFSRVSIERSAQLLAQQDHAWDLMVRDLSIDPLVLWYEDLVASPQTAVRQVAAYLGIELDGSARIDVPAIRRQAQDEALEWRRLYEAS